MPAPACSSRAAGSAGPPALFEEVPPEKSGLAFVHENAMSPERYLPETMGPGCAFLDYDNDGWMDVYIVNSGPCDFFQPRTPLRNALYRNNRDGTFTDVTEKAGVAGGTFGMGVAVGDYDNDGYPDLFVTAYGRCILYHNNGDGTFTDVTQKAGVAAPGWTTSAVWFDYDDDGRLDLFVCSFVEFGLGQALVCGDNKLGRRYYCIPRVFKPTPSLLFHNNGDGTFTEVSKGTDIARALGKALGVVATDVNDDGRLDLFVANDTVQNFLFVNRGRGRFEEIGLAAEVGYGANGQPRSGHGCRRGGRGRGRAAGPLRGQRRPRDVLALPEQRGRVLHGHRARPRHRPGHAAPVRLGPQALRLRQRRPAWTSSSPTATPTTWWRATAAR